MKTFYYRPSFYPYCSYIKAKNLQDAFNKVQKMYPEYKGLKNFTIS